VRITHLAFDLGVKAGVIEKSGAWYSFDSIRIGQGKENSKTFLSENPEIRERIEEGILGKKSDVADEMTHGGEDADAPEVSDSSKG
jgi:recombination protein RecA